MNKCFLKLTVLFIVSTIGVLLNGCTKDLSEIVAGEYTGSAELYFFTGGPSQPGITTKVNVVKLGKTAVRLDINSDSTQYNSSAEYNIKYDGTFGPGFYTPTGNTGAFGSQGRFINDSLYYVYSNSSYSFYFKGRKK